MDVMSLHGKTASTAFSKEPNVPWYVALLL